MPTWPACPGCEVDHPPAKRGDLGTVYHVSRSGGHAAAGFPGEGRLHVWTDLHSARTFLGYRSGTEQYLYRFAVHAQDLHPDRAWEQIEGTPHPHAFTTLGRVSARRVELSGIWEPSQGWVRRPPRS